MQYIKKIFISIAMALVLLVLIHATQASPPGLTWIAPKSADTLKNTLANNYNATTLGKILFEKKCVLCHGSEGKGDGIGGIALNPRPENLTNPFIQKQTDGAIFWKITNGKSPMASYKVILQDEQRWQLVDYIRQLGKNDLK